MKSSNLAIQPQTDVYILLEVIPDIEQRYSFVHFTSVSKYREQTDGISICGTGELLTVKKPSLVALEDISKIADTPERYTTSIEKMPTIDCENRKPFQGKISLQAHDAVEIEGEVYGEQKWQVYVAMKDNYLVYPIAINQRHFCFRACKKDVQEIQEFGLQQVEDNDELEHGIQKEWFSTNTVKRFQRGMESLIGDNPVGCHEAFREEKLDEAASQEEALYLLEMLDETYRRIRDDLPTRKTFFDDIRALTRYMCFNSWEVMLTFMARGLELEVPDTS